MKKLLLILLIPMIGFGQSESLDTLVFSDGKKVNAIIIEVGIDEVKYRFKNENNTNIIQTNKLAKIIFSSGRTQTFKGNQKLKFKEEGKQRKEEWKRKLENKKKKRESYNSSFEIGAIFGGSLNNNTTDIWIGGPDNQKKHITTIQGLIVKYNYSPHFSINTQLNYHITGWNRNSVPIETSFVFDGNVFLKDDYEIKATNHYLSLPITIEYSFHNKPNFIVKTGFYSAYLTNQNLEIEHKDYGVLRKSESHSYHSANFSNMSNLFSDNTYSYSNIYDLNTINRFDFGGILGIGLSYPINDELKVLFDCSAYFGITDFYNDKVWEGSENRKSKNQSYTAILGLTYNLSKD